MLDALDSVPWGQLEHAHGAASDVPGLIRALLSDRPDDRDDALAALFGNIWHQGTVYEASAFAVPFLFEVLACLTPPDDTGVAVLLASLAGGRGYLQVHGWLPNANWPAILRKRGTTLAVELAREEAVVAAVRKQISPRLPVLMPYLGHSEPTLRQRLAEGLVWYPEHRAAVLPAITTALAQEHDDDVREELTTALQRLRADGPV